MKKVLSLSTIVFLATLLVGCGGSSTPISENEKKIEPETAAVTSAEPTKNENKSDKVEVVDYLDEVRGAYLELASLGERWDEIRTSSADGEMEDSEFGEILYNEIIPTNMELLEHIEGIYTPNEETVEINEILIDAVGNQQLAFTEMLSAIETGDSSKVTSANSLLNEVRKSDREFARKVEKLLTDYNITSD